MVQFWGTNEHDGGRTHTPHGTKHTLNARVCSFEYQWTREGPYTHSPRWTQMYESTYTHREDFIRSTRTIHDPLFLENATEIRYCSAFLSCSVCCFISQPRVSGPKTKHEGFVFRSLISCMRLANLRETKKASPNREISKFLMCDKNMRK